MLVELLHREAEARRSPEIQAAMEKAEESVNSEWMEVIEQLQRRIVIDYNATLSGGSNCGGTTISVNDLRRAALRHPEVAFWVKYNRARSGKLRVGEVAPDVPLLHAVDSRETTLLATTKSASAVASKAVVVLAGSLS
jgi:hypothetical protein